MSDSRDPGDVTGTLTGDPLAIVHSRTDEIMSRLLDVAESLSIGFDRWDEQHVSGPSLYFIVVADVDYGPYTDPLGENTWPIDVCQSVHDGGTSLVGAASEVAFSCDGAIVVTVDGTIQEQMVRVKSPSVGTSERSDAIEYADWMGTKHLSAAEISTREGVLAAVTVSEENGRVTVFQQGQYDDRQRDELGGRWRANRGE